MDTLCARVLDDNTLSKEVLVTLVASPFNKVSFDAMRKLRAIYQSLDTSSAAYTQQLNLKPSYSIWDNTLISQFYSNRGIYAIFHTDSTRCDDAVVFSEHNCAAKGTSGCVLTCQLMAEVAFKLGRTPKYGA
ncbi:hypothetical protein BDF19DRAFT_92179 [Syncephalis fuscata]|nr:hypothetical protein BDF19DRAFT_92179 [Syncephalis fuscata]